MNKRGDFTSMMIMIAVVIALAIGVIIFSKVFLMVTGELKTSSDINFDNDTIAIIEVVETKTIPLLDFFIFFSLVALMIGLIISSIYIDVHPAVTVIFIVALIVGIFLAECNWARVKEIEHRPLLANCQWDQSALLCHHKSPPGQVQVERKPGAKA